MGMIVIKRMEMPKNCFYCRFNYDGLCHAVGQSLREGRLEPNGRLKSCPLIEVALGIYQPTAIGNEQTHGSAVYLSGYGKKGEDDEAD